MNAQFAKSFLLCFAKDILQRKSVLLDIFRTFMFLVYKTMFLNALSHSSAINWCPAGVG